MNLSSYISNFKIACRIIAFLLIFGVLFHFLSLCIYKKGGAELAWDTVYDHNEQVDLVAFGNSHCFTTVNTKLMSLCGISSINVGESSEYFPQTYYSVLEVLKYRDPDFLVIELNSLMYGGMAGYEDRLKFIFSGLYGMKLSGNRIRAMMAALPDDEYMNALSPLILHHDNWINYKDFYKTYKSNTSHHPIYHRFSGKTHIIEDDLWKKMERENRLQKYRNMDLDPIKIPDGNLEMLEKIIELCREKEIVLILIKSPVADSRFYVMAKRFELIEQEYGVKIYDYNMLFDDLDLVQDDFYDYGHVSINGANKVTMHLIKSVLASEYGYDYDTSLLSKSFLTKRISYDALSDHTYRYDIEHYQTGLVYQFEVYRDGKLFDTRNFNRENTFTYSFIEPGKYTVKYIAASMNDDGSPNIEKGQTVTETFYPVVIIS